MILSIITINRNNALGLEKTMRSVISQTCQDFEYVVIDGSSTDGSVDVINKYTEYFGERIKWISEIDSGIYNAMNKGIRMASGEYVEFVNSGDCLANSSVVHSMIDELANHQKPDILYGNMIKTFPDNSKFIDYSNKGQEPTLFSFYRGSMNHSPAFIKRTLFERYGLYDESLKICSDWKWYMQSIILGDVNPIYVPIDVTEFDMTGISETNKDLLNEERNKLLSEMIPPRILMDYDNHFESISQMSRIKKYKIVYFFVWFTERALFKLEKWGILK